ncbi:MAG: rhodanese-like domain-containing protein [Acetanaerobacterium sp.]
MKTHFHTWAKGLVLFAALLMFAGCTPPEDYVMFIGVVEEIYEQGLLVADADLADADRASVSFAEDMEPGSFNLLVGQTVRVTIEPEIRESYPVQVTAVKIELIADEPGQTGSQTEDSMEEENTQSDPSHQTITPERAKELMDSEAAVVVLDVRAQSEYDEGHIEGAVLLPDTEVSERAEELLPDKDALILVYCRSGRRSALAAGELAGMGYTNIMDFGGIIDWTYETVK